MARALTRQTDPYNWLKAIYCQWVLHGLWLICLPFLPESPWWHARGHRADKCKAALRRLNANIKDYNADREYEAMQREIEHEEERKAIQQSSTYKEIFTHPNLKRTLGGGFGIMSLMLSGTRWVGACLARVSGGRADGQYHVHVRELLLPRGRWGGVLLTRAEVQVGLPNPFQATVIA